MKYILDFLPLIVFFIFYKKLDIFYASIALVFTNIFSILMNYLFYKKIEKSSIFLFLTVLISSGLTLFFRNESFVKLKITVIYLGISFLLIINYFFSKKTFFQKKLGRKINLSEKAWKRLNLVWALFFLICALINAYIAFYYSKDVWVIFKVFGLPIITLIFCFIIVRSILNKVQ